VVCLKNLFIYLLFFEQCKKQLLEKERKQTVV